MALPTLLIKAALTAAAPLPESAVLAIVKDMRAKREGPAQEIVSCLKIDGNDPTTSLLSKIRMLDSSYVLGSECHFQKNGFVVHAPTGKFGSYISISDFRQQANSAEAEISTRAGPRSGGRWTARFRLQDGDWAIESTTMDVIF